MITRKPSFPAPSGQLQIDSNFKLGLLKAVEEGVERAWQTRKAALLAESGLKPKSFAWLAADFMGDPFLPSEIAERLGKAMQTRAAGLKREEKAERDRSRGERRSAQNADAWGHLEGNLDDAYCAIASRLHTRLEALFDQPYPAYAMACRPSLDTASPPPLAEPEVVATAAGDEPGDKDAVPRAARDAFGNGRKPDAQRRIGRGMGPRLHRRQGVQ